MRTRLLPLILPWVVTARSAAGLTHSRTSVWAMSNAGIPIASFGVAQLVVDPGKSSALCAVTGLIAATASGVFTVVDDHREVHRP